MVGDNQPTPPHPETFVGRPYTSESARFTKQSLRDSLEAMHTYFPVQTFNNRSEFNPDEWTPGTIVLYDREILRKPNADSYFDPDDYTSLELPAKPTDLHPNLDRDALGIISHKDTALDITYIRGIMWGVVGPTKSERHTFHRFPTSMTYRRSLGKVTVNSPPPQTVPIEIGRTVHKVLPEDRLERTNILHVCLMGSAKREKQQFLARGFLGRFATDNA